LASAPPGAQEAPGQARFPSPVWGRAAPWGKVEPANSKNSAHEGAWGAHRGAPRARRCAPGAQPQRRAGPKGGRTLPRRLPGQRPFGAWRWRPLGPRLRRSGGGQRAHEQLICFQFWWRGKSFGGRRRRRGAAVWGLPRGASGRRRGWASGRRQDSASWCRSGPGLWLRAGGPAQGSEGGGASPFLAEPARRTVWGGAGA
jgi:hypothetical protein